MSLVTQGMQQPGLPGPAAHSIAATRKDRSTAVPVVVEVDLNLRDMKKNQFSFHQLVEEETGAPPEFEQLFDDTEGDFSGSRFDLAGLAERWCRPTKKSKPPNKKAKATSGKGDYMETASDEEFIDDDDVEEDTGKQFTTLFGTFYVCKGTVNPQFEDVVPVAGDEEEALSSGAPKKKKAKKPEKGKKGEKKKAAAPSSKAATKLKAKAKENATTTGKVKMAKGAKTAKKTKNGTEENATHPPEKAKKKKKKKPAADAATVKTASDGSPSKASAIKTPAKAGKLKARKVSASKQAEKGSTKVLQKSRQSAKPASKRKASAEGQGGEAENPLKKSKISEKAAAKSKKSQEGTPKATKKRKAQSKVGDAADGGAKKKHMEGKDGKKKKRTSAGTGKEGEKGSMQQRKKKKKPETTATTADDATPTSAKSESAPPKSSAEAPLVVGNTSVAAVKKKRKGYKSGPNDKLSSSKEASVKAPKASQGQQHSEENEKVVKKKKKVVKKPTNSDSETSVVVSSSDIPDQSKASAAMGAASLSDQPPTSHQNSSLDLASISPSNTAEASDNQGPSAQNRDIPKAALPAALKKSLDAFITDASNRGAALKKTSPFINKGLASFADTVLALPVSLRKLFYDELAARFPLKSQARSWQVRLRKLAKDSDRTSTSSTTTDTKRVNTLSQPSQENLPPVRSSNSKSKKGTGAKQPSEKDNKPAPNKSVKEHKLGRVSPNIDDASDGDDHEESRDGTTSSPPNEETATSKKKKATLPSNQTPKTVSRKSSGADALSDRVEAFLVLAKEKCKTTVAKYPTSVRPHLRRVFKGMDDVTAEVVAGVAERLSTEFPHQTAGKTWISRIQALLANEKSSADESE